MPTFRESQNRALLLREGLFISVSVSLPSGAPVAMRKPVLGRALIDTGAESTCIRHEVLADLGALFLTTVVSHTSGGSVTHGVYIVRFEIPALEIVFDPVRIPEVTLDGYPSDIIALIGRDILSRCSLEWRGLDGTWSLSI
jgi:hypothetical protein